jgi:TRAP-type C4-dicarboxylate transport system permease small subunit
MHTLARTHLSWSSDCMRHHQRLAVDALIDIMPTIVKKVTELLFCINFYDYLIHL